MTEILLHFLKVAFKLSMLATYVFISIGLCMELMDAYTELRWYRHIYLVFVAIVIIIFVGLFEYL